MTLEVWAMMGAGVATLVAGLALTRKRFDAASGAGKALVLGPVFEAVALAVFAAEHFTAARDLMGLVPKWLPGPLFWTYLVGAAWLAAAISFIAWRQVRWSAAGVALLMWTFVATLDMPMFPKGPHDRFFWILTVRELAFGSGALALAGSLWQSSARGVGAAMMRVGRGIVAATMIFYGIEHFLFPLNVPGVPLELTDAGVDAGAETDCVHGGNGAAGWRSGVVYSSISARVGGRGGGGPAAADGVLLRSDFRGGDARLAGAGGPELRGRHGAVGGDGFAGGGWGSSQFLVHSSIVHGL